MSPLSHTGHLQPAAGRGGQEAAGHGAAPLPPAGFGCLHWHRARGTSQETARLGRAAAAALPGGRWLCRAAHISDVRLQLWVRLLREQIHYWPLAALMVQKHHKSTQKDCSWLICFASGGEEQETSPELSLLPHDTSRPEKSGPKGSKARGAWQCRREGKAGYSDTGSVSGFGKKPCPQPKLKHRVSNG